MKWASPRKRLSTDQRADLYEAARGGNGFPACNLCGFPVLPHQDWDESHEDGKPHVFGGTATGIAHRRCNSKHGADVVTPFVAQVKRKYKFFRGIKVPRRPFASKDKPMMRTIDGRVVNRETGEEWRPGRKSE
jgi:hypothetical protein